MKKEIMITPYMCSNIDYQYAYSKVMVESAHVIKVFLA